MIPNNRKPFLVGSQKSRRKRSFAARPKIDIVLIKPIDFILLIEDGIDIPSWDGTI